MESRHWTFPGTLVSQLCRTCYINKGGWDSLSLQLGVVQCIQKVEGSQKEVGMLRQRQSRLGLRQRRDVEIYKVHNKVGSLG